jgi:hypothetical protein
MKATFTIDQSQFQSGLKEYVKWSKRSLPEIINQKAKSIAIFAYQLTHRADRGELMNELSLRVAGQKTNKKTGKTRNVYDLDDRRRIAGIMYVRAKAAGKALNTYQEYKAGALKYSANRLTAIGTLAAGWIGAIRKLAAATQSGVGDVQWKRHKGIGTAKPAVNGWNPTTEFAYNLQERKPGGFQIDPRCQDALQAAFDREASSMMDYVAKKMQEGADRVNAK